MTTDQTWTPAPRGGLIPLYPLSFGTIMGKTFAALRSNPRVLLGFALCVQILVALVSVAIMVALVVLLINRLNAIPQDDPDEANAIIAGVVALGVGGGIVVSVLLGVFGVIVQVVVLGVVGYAALGEPASLGSIWRRVKHAVWPVLGWFVLTAVATLLLTALVVGILVGSGIVFGFFTIVIGVIVLPAALVLGVWLSIKLTFVTAAIVFERQPLFAAVARSWRLVRGRFWRTFGIVVLMSLIINIGGSVITIPFSFLTSAIGSIFIPTGTPTESQVVAFAAGAILPQVASLLVAAIGSILQATTVGLLYLDARMREEGLDLRMQDHIAKRASGSLTADDPYAYDPEAVAPQRVEWPPYVGDPTAQGYPAPPGYAAPQGYAPPSGHPAPGGYPPSQGFPSPGHGGQPAVAPQTYGQAYGHAAPGPAAPQNPSLADAPVRPPSNDTTWRAPASDEAEPPR